MSRVARLVIAVVGVTLVAASVLAATVGPGLATGALCGGLLALVLVTALGVGVPELQGWGPLVFRGSRHSGAVALSFDDGPIPETLPALLAALEEARATATFFLLLDRARAHPELVARIALRHEIGLHGLSHSARQVFVGPQASAAQLRAAADELSRLAGRPVRWYRPPFGVISPRLYEAARLAGLRLTWCSVRTWDGGPTGASAIRARAGRAAAGDIVLLHDGRSTTASQLPGILSDLAGRGLRTSSLSAITADQHET